MDIQRLPEGLALLAPGPELAAALPRIDPARLSGEDLPELVKAQARQRNHEDARLLRGIAVMGRRNPHSPDPLAQFDAPGRYAHNETRFALAMTREAAATEQCLADSVFYELPLVWAAMDAGVVDRARAKVFIRHLAGLPPAHIDMICQTVVPEAGELTTSQLAHRLAQLVIALDPERASAERRRAHADRRVLSYLDANGTVTITAEGLAPGEAIAAANRLHTLAKAIKRAGCTPRPDQGRPVRGVVERPVRRDDP